MMSETTVQAVGSMGKAYRLSGVGGEGVSGNTRLRVHQHT